ncbi:MAG TPA: DNA replication and repair protein RecF [Gemmatimonadaceae bacterium]|nr:DNA replication and repair protein RecF [Gemmatimonadaceae bacterium]
MRLARLAVRDFRNLERVEVEIPPEGMVVVGENGHGKTNLLEAAYYLQLLRSARGARDVDLVRFGSPAFHVAAETSGARGSHGIGVGFERATKRKRVTLDGSEPPRLSDALGALPAVLCSPRDAALVSGSPSERRRYLDVVLALTSRPYLAALQSYRGALARRNAALRDGIRSTRDEARVAVWEPALAEHGARIWSARVAWVRAHEARFASVAEAIGERGVARMRYATSLEPGEQEVESALAHALAAKRALDLRRGLTHAGPHRDDLELTLDGRELRTFGSAGQQRTAAIALRVLEQETLRQERDSSPLLLLDDPFAELDARRSARILELFAGEGAGQTILAVPRETDIPPSLTRLARWRVQHGALSPWIRAGAA